MPACPTPRRLRKLRRCNMPVGNRKNLLYGLALPLFGRRCHWRTVARTGAEGADVSHALRRALRKGHVVGGCIQRMEAGRLTECYSFGNARLDPAMPVTPQTYFRTASIAKMACAVLVMRLQTLGMLDVEEDISALWGAPIRNPNHPDTAIPLRALLSHTSGLADSPLYYSSYQKPSTVSAILDDPATYTVFCPFRALPLQQFCGWADWLPAGAAFLGNRWRRWHRHMYSNRLARRRRSISLRWAAPP